jgi:glycosyltransferase involved in cell wall biosynthesis
MRIAQIATLSSAVRQNAHGSIESLVWLLTRELVRLGHEVTVFGAAGAEVDGRMVETLPGPYGEKGSPGDWHLCEWINMSRALSEAASFDVIHSHNYLWGIPLEPLSCAPMVHTLHIAPDDDAAQIWARSPASRVTAISRFQWSEHPQLSPIAVVPHGIDAAQFTFNPTPGDYVCYLGRFIPGKGPCQAIAAARMLGVRLIMAGPRNAYFKERVEPLIDGKNVEYVGFVKGADRDKLLGGARALVYPIQYQEPFGLVLVESMLCGTPVAALNLGAVPDVIDQGITGAYVESLDQFTMAMRNAMSLDRTKVREHAATRFSPAQMAQAYLKVYENAVAQRRP